VTVTQKIYGHSVTLREHHRAVEKIIFPAAAQE
jgi:hypothetical protein